MRRRGLAGACLVLALSGGAPAVACQGRPTVWDIELGAAVQDLPAGFTDHACGSNGGPPGQLISGFGQFRQCKPDASGLYEVAFRYDDEAEFVARALEQSRALALCEGTTVLGYPVVPSVLIDDDGIVRGLRFASDPRGVEPADRSDAWGLGTILKRRYGAEDWVCHDLQEAPGETPVARFRLREECLKSADGIELSVRREYYHRAGQTFTDEFGNVQPTHFVSQTRFEMRQAPAKP
jgi:hypothetical protein